MASRKTSIVWEHFEKDNPSQVKCLLCKKTFAYSGNTTNMQKHLDRAHPVAIKEAKEKATAEAPKRAAPTQQQTINTSLSQGVPYGNDSLKKKQLDRLVIEMIALDIQPIKVVDDAGFRNLLRAPDPRYRLPSRRQVTKVLLPERCKTERERVHTELATIDDVALTTDIWTSRATQGYLTVTVHFVNQLWQLESLVIDTRVIEGDHTGDVIAKLLQEIVQKWNISQKVKVVVSDNGSNIAAALRQLGWRHVPCTAHTLNLVVKHALDGDETEKNVVKKVKDIVGFFNKSVKATDRLMQVHQEGGENDPKKLKQDCETRWNATYSMLKRFHEIHRYVHAALTLLGRGRMCISDVELVAIESCLKVLQPFLEATEVLSGDKYPSMSLVLQILRSVQEILSSVSDELLRHMRKYFLNHETSYFVAAATVLDPRIKKVPFSSDAAYQAIHQRLVTELQNLYRSLDFSTESGSAASTSEPGTPQPTSLWDTFDWRVEALENSRTPHITVDVELNNYLKEPILKRKEDPLLWWSQRAASHPQLHKLARRHLGVPATSGPSERLFSTAGELISHKRSCLKPKNVNDLLFLNKSLKNAQYNAQ